MNLKTSQPITRRRRILVAAVAALAVGGGAFTVFGTPASPADTGPAGVELASSSTLGSVLADGQGRTLYVFAQDEPGLVTCTGGCANDWPPLTVPAGQVPSVGPGIDQGLLGTAASAEAGTQVVTYAGAPLYRYRSDAAGETRGQGIKKNGGLWFAVTATGERVK